jgi:hypothetical protein
MADHEEPDWADVVQRAQLWLYERFGYCTPQEVADILLALKREKPDRFAAIRQDLMAGPGKAVPRVVSYLNSFYCES